MNNIFYIPIRYSIFIPKSGASVNEMQNWILNKETGRFELSEEVQSERNKTKQKALFDFHTKEINESRK